MVGFADVGVRRHRVLGPELACGCDRFDAPLTLDSPNDFGWRGAQGRRGFPRSGQVVVVVHSWGEPNPT